MCQATTAEARARLFLHRLMRTTRVESPAPSALLRRELPYLWPVSSLAGATRRGACAALWWQTTAFLAGATLLCALGTSRAGPGEHLWSRRCGDLAVKTIDVSAPSFV